MQFQPLAETRGFLYCYPDGTIDRTDNPYWNATDAGSDFFNTGTDDAGYLRGVIEEIGSQFAVDRKRIHLIGYATGGFMAYRMACQSADLIAGIASLAGMTFLDYGSDLAGSIRIPASFCGVYGLKPSVEVVPVRGLQPPGPRPDPSEMLYMSAVGPFGRSACDLRTALRVTAGPEAPLADAYSWTLPPSRGNTSC